MPTMATKMIITGAPVAWLRALDDADGSVALATPIMKFDNIQDGGFTIKAPADAAGGGTGDTIDIARGDSTVIQFTKPSLVIDGVTDNVKSSSTSTGGTVKDEVKFKINEADMDSATWTAFIKKLQGLMGTKVLVCLPTGYTYDAITNTTPADVKPDGYVFLCGKISADLSAAFASNTPTAIELTITGCDVSNTDDDQADTAFATHGFVGIPVKGRTGTTLTPTAMGATDGHLLVAGRIHLLAAA
ncbi:MAG: hypothetical protein JSS89_13345 [Bacteroidetes bacterium]|nr:hypothetical protein [Bacteroidota bacterium]